MRDGALDPATFRASLAARILGLFGVASLAGQGAACWDGEIVLSGFGGGGTGGGTTTTTSGTRSPSSTSGTGGSGGWTTGGTGGTTTTTSPPCGGESMKQCFVPSTMPCPTAPADALVKLTSEGCPETGYEACQVDSPPTQIGDECCYWVHAVLCTAPGRPYLVEGRPLTAARGSEARGWVERAPIATASPDTGGLTPADRAALAEAWTADGLLEHASVASFARFSLALLAAGAPAELVAGAHQAALDEVRHARLCFGLASAYAEEVISPGAFPLCGAVSVGTDLSTLAVSTIHEGCVGETVAAVLAAEQLARATDPAVRAALAQIAADEARHAELAWRTVAWAVKVGGSDVRAVVAHALRGLLGAALDGGFPGAPVKRREAPARRTPMEAHGRLDSTTLATVVRAAMSDVVAPAARMLLRRAGAAHLENTNFVAA